MPNEQKNHIVVHSLATTPLAFPTASEFVDKDFSKKTREIIQEYGVRESDGKTALNAKGLQHTLCTDSVGAKKFYNRLPESDKYRVGDDRFVRTPALKRELDERIEKPYDAQKIEQLKENERCLTALRDNIESQRQRAINESKIRAGQRLLKSKKIDRDNISECEHSGAPLQADAHAHHKERRADNPDLALDLDNIEIVNPSPHEAHHKKERGITYE
ncbi:hypothetical protein M4R22_02795 [Acidovorax sp. GBBC 3334]|uniref:hypothetical protein n=1 Tax=Acidovorax sp. GBBC 3334 TaxID=2940496 RepID=UPI002304AED5|nr:hypothetical protein [Acidovorax sp. GBBC 3334]MDA8453684.1 hypothetical protein [Acidovorax sp. GBBC 3334]